jgi:hypothetical protein
MYIYTYIHIYIYICTYIYISCDIQVKTSTQIILKLDKMLHMYSFHSVSYCLMFYRWAETCSVINFNLLEEGCCNWRYSHYFCSHHESTRTRYNVTVSPRCSKHAGCGTHVQGKPTNLGIPVTAFRSTNHSNFYSRCLSQPTYWSAAPEAPLLNAYLLLCFPFMKNLLL